MKLLIYGNNTEEIKKLAEKTGFEIVDRSPEIVGSYGGDGTFMMAEHDFPGVPKFLLKGSRVCKLCSKFSNEEVLKKIASGKYREKEQMKIEAKTKSEKIVGLNEIIVHNSDPRRAIRYEIIIDGEKMHNEIIGDGVAVSTPIGSTGYYRSITDSFFQVGIGVAFNNSTEQSDHMVLKEDSKIKVKILRGPAIVYADNGNEEIMLKEGDEIFISKSDEKAKIIKII